MANDKIIIKGAREHNLKNVNLTLPREKLIVMTGLSGSGKSSLAFDTIYADGQRRYVESLSSYARMFLGRMIICFWLIFITEQRNYTSKLTSAGLCLFWKLIRIKIMVL